MGTVKILFLVTATMLFATGCSKTDVPVIESAIVMAGYSVNGHQPNKKASDDLPQCCKIVNDEI
jgi:hypothetical protein